MYDCHSYTNVYGVSEPMELENQSSAGTHVEYLEVSEHVLRPSSPGIKTFFSFIGFFLTLLPRVIIIVLISFLQTSGYESIRRLWNPGEALGLLLRSKYAGMTSLQIRRRVRCFTRVTEIFVPFTNGETPPINIDR